MRVLLISHTCQSCTEGQPKAIELARLPGIELCVLVPDRWKHYGRWRGADRGTSGGYKLEVGQVRWPWLGPGQFYLHWYPGLSRLLRDFQPDVIDLWEEPWGVVSAHACWLRNRYLHNAKIISETEQNIDKRLPPPFEWFRRYVLRQADYVVARSTQALQVVRRKDYSGPATVVPNAVDNELFKPLDRTACRKAVGLAGFVVGYAGRLVEEKGLVDLVQAVAMCPADVNLLIIGDGPLRSEIDKMAEATGLRRRVQMIAGQPLDSLPQLFNAMDALALPSRTTARWKEQFGRVIIEANACGVPVIGTDSGAIPEVVGKAGVIVPERNPAALAKAIGLLLVNPGLARQLGDIGRQQVECQYTWRRVAERMHAVYLKATNPVCSPTEVLA